MTTLLALLVGFLSGFPGSGAGPPGEAAPPHDLHVSYGNAAVEGASVVLRLRLFQDDLEVALGRTLGVTVLAMDATPQVDGIFLRYLAGHLWLEVGETRLAPEIVARGSDLLDREPVWWYVLEYRSDTPLTTLRVRNTLLFDLFEDQRNVMKFVRFPGEVQRTYAFARGEEEVTVEFGR